MADVFLQRKEDLRALPRWLGAAAASALAALALRLTPQLAPQLTPPWPTLLQTLSLCALLACLFGAWRAWLRSLAAQMAREQDWQQIINEAIEAMPAGFELWDRRDRLLLCNQALRRLYPSVAAELQPGVSLHTVLQKALQSGAIQDAVGNETRWLEQRLAERGSRREPLLQQYADRWFHVYEQRTPSGYVVGLRLDVTELIHAQQALATTQSQAHHDRQLMERAIDAMPAGIEIYDEQDRLVLVNQRMVNWLPHRNNAQAVGKDYEALVQSSWFDDLLPSDPEARKQARQLNRQALRGQQDLTLLNQTPGGLWLKTTETRTPEGFVLTVRQDVSDLIHKEQALKASQAQLKAIIGTAGVSILTLNDDGVILSCNPAVERLFGYARAEMVGSAISLLIPDQSGEVFGTACEVTARHKSGQLLTVQLALAAVPDQDDDLFVAVLSDITQRKQFEQELQVANARLLRLSTTDSLTDLANRRLLMDRLDDEWRRGLRSGLPLSLALIDVDHFKLYNDHYGHQAGDQCLARVAEVLRKSASRPADLVARYGGEEFVILLAQTDADGALAVATRCRELLRAANISHANSPQGGLLTFSIGLVTQVPKPGSHIGQWLALADQALYQAKAEGRDRAVAAQPAASS
ncbi:sensor domain-containing diguanylate cyclase [Paucibacter sp. KCTC 42545]|uniref:sensor domain-containing diguanylate cyclase n=1 Tax=Paucibacter sp. KCTC 42545 TaxID=1768242 RepID=UPI000733B9FB|nr:diguanylate cyclase [Paucibacter sp. KCTC 42545]ALT78550.1 hypothetical protein AT984_16490 [Paucibacter sp. KCTC 42545]